MISSRRSLLAILLVLGTSLSTTRAADLPTGIPGVSQAQLDAGYWIARLPEADAVLLDTPTIDALNERLVRIDPSMHDIRHLGTSLPRRQVEGWITRLTKPLAKPLYDIKGRRMATTTLEAVVANAALSALPSSIAPRYGMAIRRAALRGYPSDLRVFSRPGDTDIDRFQESTLFPGDPVAVVHTSKDGRWVFAVSMRYAAWVHAADIAYGDAATVFSHTDATPYRVITGAIARTVVTPEAPALSQLELDMGTRVPLDTTIAGDDTVNGQAAYAAWSLSLPVRDARGRLAFHPALLPRGDDSAEAYLPLTRANIVRQAFRFLGERYGWGHAYDGRDCSGFVSDVYRSMGVQMPRNTSDQAESPAFAHTAYTSSDGHDARQAAAIALDVGDLVYVPGHVMMVIGKVDGQPYVIHDVAGIGFRGEDGHVRRIKLNAVSVTPLLTLMLDDQHSVIDRMTSIVRIRDSAANTSAAWSDAQQMIVVTTPDWNTNHGSLQTYERHGMTWTAKTDPTDVMLGRQGSAWGLGLSPPQTDGPQKHEGDGRSPAGVFRIGKAFGYATTNPTAMPYVGLTASDYCVDVDGSPYYNQLVDAQKVGEKAIDGATEAMRRDIHFDGDHAYRIGFVIEHNPDGQRGAGSCIFAHLWQSPTSPTVGCTAMNDATMERLLAWLDPARHPVFVLLPKDEYARLRDDWKLP